MTLNSLFQDDKPPQKSKEELEKEKQAVLAQRIQPLSIDGLDVEKLKEAAKSLHEKMRALVSSKYDLEERFKRQQYDVSNIYQWPGRYTVSQNVMCSVHSFSC